MTLSLRLKYVNTKRLKVIQHSSRGLYIKLPLAWNFKSNNALKAKIFNPVVDFISLQPVCNPFETLCAFKAELLAKCIILQVKMRVRTMPYTTLVISKFQLTAGAGKE